VGEVNLSSSTGSDGDSDSQIACAPDDPPPPPSPPSGGGGGGSQPPPMTCFYEIFYDVETGEILWAQFLYCI
jgi:hypothetical protein